ncbi:MAG TPA: hypothetical protein DD706_16020 [Nitrospiraceae bacterium]|nr:hypothetical protein [Nitrospiraceae bacterium]
MAVKVRTNKDPRVFQGDIIRDVEYVEYVSEKSGYIEVSKIVFPLVIVLTQDCDLSQDYKFQWSKAKTSTKDKLLLSVLAAPLYNVNHVYTGEHLSDLGMKMRTFNATATEGRNLRNNETPRYHYLDFDASVSIVPSVIDFKHYFSVNTIYLKKIKENEFYL